MMRCNLTVEDAEKLTRAYRYLDELIELIEEHNRKRGIDHKPSGFAVAAHRLLREVLYDE